MIPERVVVEESIKGEFIQGKRLFGSLTRQKAGSPARRRWQRISRLRASSSGISNSTHNDGFASLQPGDFQARVTINDNAG